MALQLWPIVLLRGGFATDIGGFFSSANPCVFDDVSALATSFSDTFNDFDTFFDSPIGRNIDTSVPAHLGRGGLNNLLNEAAKQANATMGKIVREPAHSAMELAALQSALPGLRGRIAVLDVNEAGMSLQTADLADQFFSVDASKTAVSFSFKEQVTKRIVLLLQEHHGINATACAVTQRSLEFGLWQGLCESDVPSESFYVNVNCFGLHDRNFKLRFPPEEWQRIVDHMVFQMESLVSNLVTQDDVQTVILDLPPKMSRPFRHLPEVIRGFLPKRRFHIFELSSGLNAFNIHVVDGVIDGAHVVAIESMSRHSDELLMCAAHCQAASIEQFLERRVARASTDDDDDDDERGNRARRALLAELNGTSGRYRDCWALRIHEGDVCEGMHEVWIRRKIDYSLAERSDYEIKSCVTKGACREAIVEANPIYIASAVGLDRRLFAAVLFSLVAAWGGCYMLASIRRLSSARIFLSHTGQTTSRALAIKGMVLHHIPHARIWSMEDIPAGSGSAGDPKFSVIIHEKMNWCSTVLGICDRTCETSHKKWGSPAEWKMGLDMGKKVIVLYLDGHMDAAKKNPVVEDVAKQVQFFPIPAGEDANSMKIMRAALSSEIIPNVR